ncbi:MAG: tRNA lysidine(34) synthetase TilS [bacterium]|nr:tRNA lysidine(34) synthetase TilS [bacterium]
MYNQVVEYVKQYNMLEQRDRVVIGVSGGADSVCLLLVLQELKKLYDLELFVVHINHGLRGAEALRDENYVKLLCKSLGVSCHVVLADVNGYVKRHKCSTEEAGRILRYKAFEEECREKKCNKIAIAHNKNDVAETVLLNLSRGTGIRGLVGIEPVRDFLIRPLLCVTRDEIEEYLCNRKVSYCTDSTNLENVYTRNKIRNVVLPELGKVNDQVISHIVRCANHASEIENYLKKQTNELYERIVTAENGQYFVNVRELANTELVLRKRVILEMMYACAKQRKDIEEKHVAATLGLMEKPVGKKVNLPYGMIAVREYEKIVIKSKKISEIAKQEKSLNIAIEVPKFYDLQDIGIKLEVSVIDYEKNSIIPKNRCTKWFDYDKIKNTIFLRYRKQGDYLVINDRGNAKTIKSLFIDEKIPREERDSIPLLCDGNHVMWVLGGRISEEYKITEQSKKILVVTIMEV